MAKYITPEQLAVEREFGELMLAAQDMMLTVKLIERIPAERDEFDLMLDSIGVITTYCKPFTINDRKKKVGERFLGVLNAEQRQLHDRVLTLRDEDMAHSDFYAGRIHVRGEGADVWVRVGVEPEEATASDIEISVRYSHKVTSRALAREELDALCMMAGILDKTIQRRAGQLITPVLTGRLTAGFTGWFHLGDSSISEPDSESGRNTPDAY